MWRKSGGFVRYVVPNDFILLAMQAGYFNSIGQQQSTGLLLWPYVLYQTVLNEGAVAEPPLQPSSSAAGWACRFPWWYQTMLKERGACQNMRAAYDDISDEL